MTTVVIAKKTLLLSDNLPFLAFDIKFFKFKKEFSIKFLIEKAYLFNFLVNKFNLLIEISTIYN